MPPLITRDSISKCSHGNDVYSFINKPHAKVVPRSMKPVDTIDPYRARLEREASAKLGLFFKNFVVIARAGKFMFLALAIPPYILIYGIPKWVIVDMLPFLFSFSSKIPPVLKKVFKPKEVNKGLFNQFRNMYQNASLRIAEYIKSIERSAKALFVHLKHSFVALNYRLLVPYIPAIKNSFNAAEAATKMLLQKTYEKGDKHVEIAKEVVSIAWKIVKEEFSQLTKPFVTQFKIGLKATQKHLKKWLDIPRAGIQKFKVQIKNTLKRPEEIFKSAGQKIHESIIQSVTYIARPVIDWTAPKLQTLADVWIASREKISYQFEQVRSFIKNVMSGVSEAVKQGHQVLLNTFKSVFENIVSAPLKKFFDLKGGFKQKYQQSFLHFQTNGKKLSSLAKQWIGESKKVLKIQWKALLKKIKEFLKYLGYQIQTMPRRLLKMAHISYHKIIQVGIKVRNLLVWTGILSRLLMHLALNELRDRSAEVMNKVRLK